MKTKHLIEILRCPGDHRVECEKCDALSACKELAGQDIYAVSANRLEALLKNLRQTEKELMEAHQEARFWEKRYKRFLSDIKNSVQEQDILNGFGD